MGVGSNIDRIVVLLNQRLIGSLDFNGSGGDVSRSSPTRSSPAGPSSFVDSRFSFRGRWPRRGFNGRLSRTSAASRRVLTEAPTSASTHTHTHTHTQIHTECGLAVVWLVLAAVIGDADGARSPTLASPRRCVRQGTAA